MELPTCDCRLYQECQSRQTEKWAAQDQRNAAIDQLFRRWGDWKDGTEAAMAECREKVAKSINHSRRQEALMLEWRNESKQYMTETTSVLRELAESVRAAREASEANHANLMSAVTSNAALATRAVERADAAAIRADGAQRSAGESIGKLTAMTKATLTGWVLFAGSAAGIAWFMFRDYGWPAIKSWLIKL